MTSSTFGHEFESPDSLLSNPSLKVIFCLPSFVHYHCVGVLLCLTLLFEC
jgi:hypothetical protein